LQNIVNETGCKSLLQEAVNQSQ